MENLKNNVLLMISSSMPARAHDMFFMDDWDIIFPRLQKMGLTTTKRWAAFLGTLRHETGGFYRFEENLNYSAKALLRVWPHRFRKPGSAKRIAYKPREIANHVYNGRMGNRLGTDDGWNTRGSGLIQLTGMNNYHKYGRRNGLDLVNDPELLRQSSLAMWTVAADFFRATKVKGKNLFELADEGRLKEICRAVNGGYHGLADRITWTEYYNAMFENNNELKVRILCKRGSRGTVVKQCQYMLAVIAGTADKTYLFDGIFGKHTEALVKEYQANNGLVVDGIIGTRTYLKIFFEYDELIDIEDF